MPTTEKQKRKRHYIALEPLVRREVRKIAAERDINFSDAVNCLLLAGMSVSDTLVFTPPKPAA